jgi:hypothetical protein
VNTEPVTAKEIAELTAWARRLSAAGLASADAGELAAFHAAKTELLARIQTGTGDTIEHVEHCEDSE